VNSSLCRKGRQTTPSLLKEPVPLLIDNQAAIRLIDSEAERSKSKHIDLRHMWLREQAAEGVIKPSYVNTKLQWADGFTKALAPQDFQRWLAIIQKPTLAPVYGHGGE
jgi:hypothetical protein